MKIKRELVHGLTLGFGVVIWAQLNQRIHNVSILPGILLSIFFVGIYVAVILSFVKGLKINDKSTIWALILTGVLASSIISAAYLLQATVIDPSYVKDQITHSQQRWEQLGYSAEQINDQIEMTDTFQNPVKWSGVLFGFNFSVFVIIGLVMMGMKFFRREFRDKDHSTSLTEGQ